MKLIEHLRWRKREAVSFATSSAAAAAVVAAAVVVAAAAAAIAEAVAAAEEDDEDQDDPEEVIAVIAAVITHDDSPFRRCAAALEYTAPACAVIAGGKRPIRFLNYLMPPRGHGFPQGGEETLWTTTIGWRG